MDLWMTSLPQQIYITEQGLHDLAQARGLAEAWLRQVDVELLDEPVPLGPELSDSEATA